MRILIADDDDVARLVLEDTLCRAGHEVIAATNGREALEVVRAGTCSMVISDWEMPEMNGLELCRAVRSNLSVGYTYFMLLTSRDRGQDTLDGLSAGADDFLTKPFDAAELNLRVRTGERILSLETRDLTIFALAKLAESRDPDTGAHLERVRNYSRVLAQQVALDPKFSAEVDGNYIRLIYLTSPLHDIGKVAIPDNILLKPGKLTDDEFAVMRSHAAFGAETLAATLREHPGAKFLEMARDIAVAHHEKFDGSGYPNKLVGNAIPLCARIVALADVYDALTSKRVYKRAMTHDEAKAIILDSSGKHFDPDIIAAFLTREQDFLEIQHRHQDEPIAPTA